MGARFRSWWQRVRKPLEIFAVIVGCILVIALLVVIILAYVFNVNVPGLSGKTLWDWMQLLIIPLVLAIIALVFQLANSRTERQIAKQRYEQDLQIAKQRYEQDRQIALDKQREDLLQVYLDRMSELLLKEKLRTSEEGAEVRNVARVRTITVLTQLDTRRIGYVFAFLREAGLMSNKPSTSVVSLHGADLRKINLRGADLGGADLSGADLGGADLSGADLGGADLRNANLYKANLSQANLSQATLSQAILILEANFLHGADLNRAVQGFYGALGTKANLTGSNLAEANLTRANITEEQLKQARSLKGATMPDGSIHP